MVIYPLCTIQLSYLSNSNGCHLKMGVRQSKKIQQIHFLKAAKGVSKNSRCLNEYFEVNLYNAIQHLAFTCHWLLANVQYGLHLILLKGHVENCILIQTCTFLCLKPQFYSNCHNGLNGWRPMNPRSSPQIGTFKSVTQIGRIQYLKNVLTS